MKLFGSKKKTKVFCIGFGKTGTTSIETALRDLGYIMGDQPTAEMLIKEWKVRNFNPIITYCKSADAFQDAPFCLPFTYIPIDQAFPGSKFILSVRDNPEAWYKSLLKFHTKLHGNGELPSVDTLKNATYRYKGFAWDVRKAVWDVPEEDIYNEEILKESYIRHNNNVREYFRHRPSDLLELNVAKKGAYQELCEFLDKDPMYDEFPWENKT